MKTTANFGLKKPDENEFYDVNVQNDNMDAIDKVLQEYKDGTQQVGDSAKLGGKDASEYAENIALYEHTIPSYEGKTEEEVNNIYNTIQQDKPNGLWYQAYVTHSVSHSVLGGGVFYLEGFRTNSKFGIQRITVYTSGGGTKCFSRSYANGVWYDWTLQAQKTDLANYLPLSGGTVGYLYVQGEAKNGYSHLIKNASATVDNGTDFIDVSTDNKKARLNVSANDNKAYFRGNDNVAKELLHTGNKPSGTYTGNGSTDRQVCIGDSSVDVYSTIVVSSDDNDTMAIVTREGGAICVSANGTVTKLDDSKISISYNPSVGTVMVLSTNNACLNANGVSYRYAVH